MTAGLWVVKILCADPVGMVAARGVIVWSASGGRIGNYCMLISDPNQWSSAFETSYQTSYKQDGIINTHNYK